MSTVNPSFQDVKVGDQFTSKLHTFNGRGWFYISTVLAVDKVSQRFGKDDRIVTVQVATQEGNVTDPSKKIWVSQLLCGLV